MRVFVHWATTSVVVIGNEYKSSFHYKSKFIPKYSISYIYTKNIRYDDLIGSLS